GSPKWKRLGCSGRRIRHTRDIILDSRARWQRRKAAHRFSLYKLAPHLGIRQFAKNSPSRLSSLDQEQIVALQVEQGRGCSQEKGRVAHGARKRDGGSEVGDRFGFPSQGGKGLGSGFQSGHHVLGTATLLTVVGGLARQAQGSIPVRA